jgi:uncharacterized membrane protein
MRYSLIFFFVLFSINNLLHYISEKVIIVIFIIFLFFLMRFLSNLINNEFRTKIDFILNDINMYMNVVFNFLYVNKLFYLNLKALKQNFELLTNIFKKRIFIVKTYKTFNNKINSLLNITPHYFK